MGWQSTQFGGLRLPTPVIFSRAAPQHGLGDEFEGEASPWVQATLLGDGKYFDSVDGSSTDYLIELLESRSAAFKLEALKRLCAVRKSTFLLFLIVSLLFIVVELEYGNSSDV